MAAKQPKPHDLKLRARLDLQDIWTFTAGRWSVKQANAYVRGIAEAIDRIAADPDLVRDRTEYDPPVRIYRFMSHIIIYRDLDDCLSILRIRHGAEDWTSDPEGTGG
jgi:toxin ParE1/3/4